MKRKDNGPAGGEREKKYTNDQRRAKHTRRRKEEKCGGIKGKETPEKEMDEGGRRAAQPAVRGQAVGKKNKRNEGPLNPASHQGLPYTK